MDITVMSWYESALVPLLTLMTLIPLATLIAILIIDTARFNVFLAFFGAILTGLLSVYLLLTYDPENTGIQLAEHAQFFNLSYAVGVDGANILFLPLTTVLTFLTLLYLQATPYRSDSGVLSSLLGYETILIGAFSALNALQFWLWCAAEIFPVAFLTLATSSSKQRGKAVKLLSQFWAGGLLITLLGFLLLGFDLNRADNTLSFDWLTLAQNDAPFLNETLIFILLMYGFAVRMPLFPFHAWLPLLAEQDSVVAGTVFIVGLKLGIYGVIRFVLALLPGVSEEWSGLIVALGLIGIFYGAVLAFMQHNIRRLLAFAVISHTGALILGVFSFEVVGVEGSLLLSLAYGLATAGLLLSVGFIVERMQTAFMPRLGGLLDTHLALAVLFLVSALSLVAMPGTPGFDAAHMLIEGIIEKNGWIIALLIGLGNLLAGALLLGAFQRLFLAEVKRPIPPRSDSDPRLQERTVSVLTCGLLIATGFYSAPWQSLIDTATGTIGKYYDFHNAIYNEEQLNNAPEPDTLMPPPENDNTLMPSDEPALTPDTTPHD